MSDPALFREGWNTSGLLAPRGDIEIADPAWPQAYAVFREQMKTAIQRGPHPQWSQLSRPIQIAIQEALTGTKPAAEALKDAAAKIAAGARPHAALTDRPRRSPARGYRRASAVSAALRLPADAGRSIC